MLLNISSWFTDSKGCSQLTNGDNDKTMEGASRPTLENYLRNGTKRKRSMSDEATFSIAYFSHRNKRSRNLNALRSPVSPLEKKSKDVIDEPEPNLDLNSITDTIENQFNLEILLKHKELRLIHQELAKCQVALEQLRRCHLIPYPVNLETPEAMLHVSDGTSLSTCQDNRRAPWAPPFGVTDGPYTRHYAKWLISDPSFDGVVWQEADESYVDETGSEEQAHGNNYAEGVAKVTRARLQGRTSQKLQAFSCGYSQLRDNVGPCITKRGDGQTVKLVCLDCNRENFQSTQGFINHCRIAHRRDFKSHVKAADASGQSVKLDKSGQIIGSDKTSAVFSDVVHPLIKNAPTGEEARDACRALLARLAESKAMLREGRLPGFSSIPKGADPKHNNSSFQFTSSKPHLSELLHRKRFPGNVDDMINEFSQKIDFEEMLDEEDSNNLDDPERFSVINRKNCNCHELSATSLSSLTKMCQPGSVDLRPSSRAHFETAECITEKGLETNQEEKSAFYASSFFVSNEKDPATPDRNFSASDLRDDDDNNDDNDGGSGRDMKLRDGLRGDEFSPHTLNTCDAPSLVSDNGEYDEDIVDSGTSDTEGDIKFVADITIEDEEEEEEADPRSNTRLNPDSRNEESKARVRTTPSDEKDTHVTYVKSFDKVKNKRLQFRRS